MKLPFVLKNGKVSYVNVVLKRDIVYNNRRQNVWVGRDKFGNIHKRAVKQKSRGRKSGARWN